VVELNQTASPFSVPMADRPLAVLRFDVAQPALHAVFAGGFTAVFVYIAWDFASHGVDMASATHGRSGWFFELGNTADGWTGFALWTGLALLSGWWLVRALWRLITRRPAVTLGADALEFRPSYLRRLVLLRDVASACVREEAPARLFGAVPPIHALEIMLKPAEILTPGRTIKVRSNTVEGGRAALRKYRGEIAGRLGA
jgi:hypothetical protein